MNCPSCQLELDPAVSVCPSCAYRIDGTSNPLTLLPQPPARRPKIQVEVDLAVTVDRTGSSKAFATGIPRTFELVVGQLAGKARTVKVWLQSHGDLDEGQEHILHTNGGTPDAAVADIQQIVFDGGGDPPEHHLDAIEALLDQLPWTADPLRARGAILAFMTADTKPARSGVSAAALGQAIRDNGVLLYLVCEPTPTLQELVTAAGGLLFPITNNPDPTELQVIAAQVAASITQAAATGGTVAQPAAMP